MSQVNLDNVITALALMKASLLASDEQVKELGVSRQEMQVIAMHFIDGPTDQILAGVARNALRVYLIGRKQGEHSVQSKVNGAEAPIVDKGAL